MHDWVLDFELNGQNSVKNMPVSFTHLRLISENHGMLTFISIQVSELFIAYCHYSWLISTPYY